MKKIWNQLAAIAFVSAICAMISMQTILTKTYRKRKSQVLSTVDGTPRYYGEGRLRDAYGIVSKVDRTVQDELGVKIDVRPSQETQDSTGLTRLVASTEYKDENKILNVDVGDGISKSGTSTSQTSADKRLDHDITEHENLVAKEQAGTKDHIQTKATSDEEMCPHYPMELVGSLSVNASYVPTEAEAVTVAGEKLVDGCFEPAACISRQTVAIVIPYKNRRQHLITLMYHLHPILQRQSIRYCVFVAEQFDNGSFNKARVMNAAFMEITRNQRFKFECVIFHDVDMLVENDKNLYVCGDMPKHLSPAIDKFNYSLNYGTKFGGVTAIKVEHYKKVNGHSNNFWGWGGEDNDMEVRIAQNNLTISVVNKTQGKYKMIPHDHPWWFSPLYGVGSYLQSKKHWSRKKVDRSGLTDTRYNLRNVSYHKLWTKLDLDIRTVLVEKATVGFYGYGTETLEFTSPALKTENVRGKNLENAASTSRAANCVYERFTGKTVNKTLGMKERLTYGRTYDSFEKAQKKCGELGTYCGSIVEEHAGRFSLRSTGYMHENSIRYRAGMLKQTEVVETHDTQSVHVKICQGDSAYTNYFKKPIVMAGDLQGPSPAYYVELKIRMFYEANKTIFYDSDIMTAHKAVMQEKVDAGIMETGVWDTMGNVYSSRIKLLNTSDPKSVKKSIPSRFNSMSELIADGDGILTVKTPLIGILRNPGCYICRCTLVDESGAELVQWKWWFELRAKSKEIENAMKNRELEKARLTSIDFSESVEKRREMLIKYHEKLRSRIPMKGGQEQPAKMQNNAKKISPSKN